MEKTWYAVSPGTMGLCALACNLLGVENVNPGCWLTPVYVFATPEDADALVKLADEASDSKLTHRLTPRK